jgi:RNA polymerase sigma-70 factor (ECF subfamily)
LTDIYRRELADKRDIAREQSQSPGDRSSLNPLAQARDEELTPAAMLLRKEFAEQFRRAVNQLEEPSREIILMRHVEQLTNSQAAEILKLSESAAAMRYLRALRQLKGLLGGTPSVWLSGL